MDVSWKSIDRAVPYVGWLSSDSGNVQLALTEGQQNINVATTVSRHEKGALPAGQYQAKLNLKNNNLNVHAFSYVADKGQLKGNAVVELPDQKRMLKWQANVQAQQFNPQTIVAAAPVDQITGSLKANGYAKPNQQIIQLNNIDLLGRLAQQNETVHLTGQSTAALTFHDEKQGGGFKAFCCEL